MLAFCIPSVAALSFLAVQQSAAFAVQESYKPKFAHARMTASLERVTASSGVIDNPVSMPINSAGEHAGAQKSVDVVVLFLVLLVPFVAYWMIQRAEQYSLQGTPGDAQPTMIARPGSDYNMPDDQKHLSIVEALKSKSPEESEGTVLQNVLAGFSTAMAALPDAISFSFITGVSPLNGIWAGVFMGLSAALVGGRPGMISSASAATAVVLAKISTDPELGMAPMALCVFIVGILQAIAGGLRLSRFITLIPHPVMLGFVNGLAIVMVRAQLRQFHYQGDGDWLQTDVLVSMTVTALFSMICAVIWARIPLANKVLPAPLASVILTVIFSIACKGFLTPRTLKEVAGDRTFAGGTAVMPSWDFPPVGMDWHNRRMWISCISVAIRFAIVGLLESFMTAALIDQITKTSGSMRRECFGQAMGNILSSFFGTQGGCALIAQSLLNVGSGGRSRLSGVVMGLTLLLSVVALAPLIGMIPVAALVGLIVLIALNTFAWGSLQLMLRVNWIDSIVIVIVTVVTVVEDLAVAVVVGVIINALGFAWTAATEVRLTSHQNADGELILSLRGPLFFGSAMNYQTAVTKADVTERVVVLDFTDSKILDISGVEAIVKAREFLTSSGKRVVLLGLPEEVLVDIPKDDVGDESIANTVEDKTPLQEKS